MSFFNRLSELMGKYFVMLILGVAALAMVFPAPFLTLLKVRVYNQSLITIGLGVIMFIMGLTLTKDDFKVVLTRPRDILVGCMAQFTIMPLVAYFLAKTLNLPPILAVGLILLGTCPGGTASNVITYLAKGDVALSVGMTAVSTLVAPLITPVLTYFLAGEWVEINVIKMVVDIFKIVVFPILFGVIINNFFSNYIAKFKKVLVIFPIATIVIVMGMCVAPNIQNLLNASFTLILAVCLHNWFGFLLGYTVGQIFDMETSKKKALSIEVGLQNSGLALGLAGQFGNPLAILPSTLATVIHQLSGSILASIFAKDYSFEFKRKQVKLYK